MGEWREVKLGDITNLHQGLAINKKTNYLLVEKSTLPLLRIKDLQENTEEFYVNDKEAPKKCIANENDLIFTRTGIVGMVFMGKKGVVHNNCFRIVPKNNEVYLPFYYHYFNREKIRDYLTNISAGSVQPDMNHTIFKTVKVPFPPLKEQKAIAKVLSSLDDKIDLLHRQNKTLEEVALTLFRQWFIEEAKDEWEEGTLGEVINIFDNKRVPLSKMQRDKMKDGKLYPYYGAAKLMDYVNDYIFDGEYILMGEDGTVRTENGCPILQYATGKFWVNNHTHVLQAKEPYSNYFIWSYLLEKNIDEIVTGAVQPKINQTNLKSLEFPKYPQKLILQFNKQSDTYLKKINKNKQQIKTLENMRDTLLPKLMSGEARVDL